MPELTLFHPGAVNSRCGVASTARSGGVSSGVYQSLNLGDHVGDDPEVVAENRRRLLVALDGCQSIAWLSQVHGTRVVKANPELIAEADAVWTDQIGVGCAVMTADCLPVVLMSASGSAIGVAHAGWRGLLEGVLEALIDAMPVEAYELSAWLGPAIGPTAFEVGSEVKEAFATCLGDASNAFFQAAPDASKWLCDLPGLARYRLSVAGLSHIESSNLCTLTDEQHFFSYRRDGQTGRMATIAWINS